MRWRAARRLREQRRLERERRAVLARERAGDLRFARAQWHTYTSR